MIHLVALLAASLVCAEGMNPWETGDVITSLLFGNFSAYSPTAPGAKQDVQLSLADFIKRQKSFPEPKSRPIDGPEKYLFNKKLGFQKAIYSLHDREDSFKLAQEFTEEVSLIYEWEGYRESPASEAKSAAQLLRRNPKTPIASYLHLFIGHRDLCAASFKGPEPERELLLKDARKHLTLAAKSSNALIREVSTFLMENKSCSPAK